MIALEDIQMVSPHSRPCPETIFHVRCGNLKGDLWIS